MRDVHPTFEAELRRRGITFTALADAAYELRTADGALTLALDEVVGPVVRSEDPARIARLIDDVIQPVAPATFAEARPWLRWSVERATDAIAGTVHAPLTRTLAKVLVASDPTGQRTQWLSPATLAGWQVDAAQAQRAADANLDALLVDAELTIETVHDRPLGMVAVTPALKAAVLLAPSLRSRVTGPLGWPVLALMPCRDFVYLLAERDDALLDYLGDVVQREYRRSPYRLTTEVVRFADEGLTAIGAYPT
jgi:hypothetical protein